MLQYCKYAEQNAQNEMNNFRDSAFNLYQKAVVAARSSILVKYGLPFGAMMVVSFILLRQSASVRYEFTGNSVVRETEKEFRKRFNPVEVTLESVYESIKDLDLDNWENKRIQRPWEE